VALAAVDGPAAALVEVEALERDGRLAGYQYLPSTKAELLHRLGRDAEAADAYQAALALSSNAAEEQFLMERVHATTLGRLNGSSRSETPPSGVS
jgi:RNA polymerase sigma-70 factor, ECF subfamily